MAAEVITSEERLRCAVEELLSMDILPAYVVQGLGDVLLATEISDLERLRLVVVALEASERGFSEYYYEEGDTEAGRDCTMKANGMGKILDVITDTFGAGKAE